MTNYGAPRLLVFHLVLLSVSVLSYDRPEGLYDVGDEVVILDDTNFHSTITGREHAWLVEFYASWCGYCRNLAPVFKRFAKEVAAWGDVIKVAVIDCGDRINAETICQSANLSGYPTIKYYLPFAEEGDVGFNRVSQVAASLIVIISNDCPGPQWRGSPHRHHQLCGADDRGDGGAQLQHT